MQLTTKYSYHAESKGPGSFAIAYQIETIALF